MFLSCLGTILPVGPRAEWYFCWSLVSDTSTVWSRCVSLTCLESGVAHILSVAVADRFGILVADQGQIADTERRTYTASNKIWMEQLTCSLLSCHCEARNPWLMAWDRSNWQFQNGAQQHRLSTSEVGPSEMNNGVETCSLIQFCLFDMLRIQNGTFS